MTPFLRAGAGEQGRRCLSRAELKNLEARVTGPWGFVWRKAGGANVTVLFPATGKGRGFTLSSQCLILTTRHVAGNCPPSLVKGGPGEPLSVLCSSMEGEPQSTKLLNSDLSFA